MIIIVLLYVNETVIGKTDWGFFNYCYYYYVRHLALWNGPCSNTVTTPYWARNDKKVLEWRETENDG